MHRLEMVVEIRVLARQRKSIKEIARDLGLSRNTVRKYLRSDAEPQYGPRKGRATKVDPYRDYIVGRIEAAKPDWIPATVLLREIQELGYRGGLTQLKVFVNGHKPKPVTEPLVRFETEPGEQMQVDFVVFRRGTDRVSAFVATLGYSRCSYVRFVTDERVTTVIECLRRSFDAFGGVPRHVLFDNMKTVVVERDAYAPGKHRFHPEVLTLANDHGFALRLCRPYRAKTKGKVERFNRYLRESFWVPLQARFKASGLLVDAESANFEVTRWLREVANVRRHGDLKERPVDRLLRERDHLQAYAGTVVDLPAAHRHVSTPYESLQHPLSTYDALVAAR
ncbi:MAG: IS21 family transposase [Gammaproteobacteria bacterium]